MRYWILDVKKAVLSSSCKMDMLSPYRHLLADWKFDWRWMLLSRVCFFHSKPWVPQGSLDQLQNGFKPLMFQTYQLILHKIWLLFSCFLRNFFPFALINPSRFFEDHHQFRPMLKTNKILVFCQINNIHYLCLTVFLS